MAPPGKSTASAVSSPTMKLTVNGEERELPGSEPSVADLVERLGLGGQAVAVELNRRLVPRREHPATPLSEGDDVEVVTLVGGG